MAGPPTDAWTDAPPRNSSMDSAISAISTRSGSTKGQDTTAGTQEIANLIQTAGSAEAVIQYLLKDKISQSQQNAQLWRLVDKQRAMILGLNKDLERSLKEKEKYRTKLKQLMTLTGLPLLGASNAPSKQEAPQIDAVATVTKEQVVEVPISPTVDSGSQKSSPVNVSLAPYPITPPADQPNHQSGPPSAVGELLDPLHTMPKPSEHALHQFDHEAREREVDASNKEADSAMDLPIKLQLPPSRSLAKEPPRIPPPQLQARESPLASPEPDSGVPLFPTPSTRAPRKPPLAPLQLREAMHSPTLPPDYDEGSDTDYEDMLEVADMPADSKRGRRRTREEDERVREVLARQEAEMRSLSKRSSRPTSAALTPSPRLLHGAMASDTLGSLDGVLADSARGLQVPTSAGPRRLSLGLPSSPRALMISPMASPPLSPMGVHSFGSPISPRFSPRQTSEADPRAPPAAPAAPALQTPVQTPPGEQPVLISPRPLNIVKKMSIGTETPSPTSSVATTDRNRVYKGFVTEEYPDLLLPPNVLPSIAIRVASSRMKPSRASLLSMTQLEEDPVFTLAVFLRAEGGELWRVEKDSASLAKLDARLKQCPTFTAKTLDRSLFTGHAPAKLDARRLALNQYLEELLNAPLDTATALEVCKYLSQNTLPPNADETGSAPPDPAEAQKKTGPGGRPFRSGYLTKRGKNFGGWKARFFVLESSQLKYYDSPGGAHLGTIKLQKAQIGKQSAQAAEGSSGRNSAVDDTDNQYRHAFLILEPKKKDPNSVTKHVLCAESDEERDQWVDALLRWIDYKHPDEDDAKEVRDVRDDKKEVGPDRRGSGGSDRTNGSGAKKKVLGKTQQQQQHVDGESALIGVSYEATRQGEAPSKVRQSLLQDNLEQTMSSQNSWVISGPQNPQVISSTEAWGAKMAMGGGLAAPIQDDKKVRKRSFFGFGSKTRSSSDGQDSVFGTESNGSTGQLAVQQQQQHQHQQHHPVRQVFGSSLAEAVRYNSPVDVRVPLPAVVYRCIQYLDAKGAVNEEGIFRLSGSNVVIKQLRERFNNEGDINLLAEEEYHDIHAVASLLKLYLRELPTTILTRDLHLEFQAVTELTDVREKTALLGELAQRLPQANATLLKYLIAFLIKIINHADSNKMTVRNVGIVFSPTLNIPAPVFAMFLQHYPAIFGLNPEEYDPSPHNTGRERRPSVPRRPSLPNDERSSGGRRPSDHSIRPVTSGGGSPHRQRLMEAVREGQGARNATNTPPPIINMQHAQLNAMRPPGTTSTPPPPHHQQRPHNLDPHHLAQQGMNPPSRMSVRPNYENGFPGPTYEQMHMMQQQPYYHQPQPQYPQQPHYPQPPHYQQQQHYQQQHYQQQHYQQQARQNPAYDRPVYDAGPPGAFRRESMAVPTVSHQSSRSRLRE